MLYRGDYSEKRDFQRMEVECPMTFTVEGDSAGTVHDGVAQNLSASGLSVICSVEVAEGSKLEINVTPKQAIVPPLQATCTVMRADAMDGGKYRLGVQINAIHPADTDQT